MEKELKNAELLSGSINADETNETKEDSSNKQLIERIAIEKTPFHVVRTEQGCCGVFGKVRVTDWYKTVPEVEELITNFNWNIIVGVTIQVATDVVQEILRETLRQKKADTRTINDISKGGNMSDQINGAASEENGTY